MFAVYIAAVWNTYRKTHLLMLDVIFRCKRMVSHSDMLQTEEIPKAQKLAEGIVASIPYHFSSDPWRYIHAMEGNDLDAAPGKTVGGLLLLHPVWVITMATVVSRELRSSARDCLAWIGRHMGIGQATVLSLVSSRTLAASDNFTLI